MKRFTVMFFLPEDIKKQKWYTSELFRLSYWGIIVAKRTDFLGNQFFWCGARDRAQVLQTSKRGYHIWEKGGVVSVVQVLMNGMIIICREVISDAVRQNRFVRSLPFHEQKNR